MLKGSYASTVTAHFLDGQWKLNQMVLCVTDLAKRHTADNIIAHWDSVMNCWDLQNITSITTDGAKDYTKAARAFCKLSLWCCCHRLHLISSKLFDHSPILQNLFSTCKNIVTLWNHSVNFQRDLAKISKVSLKTSNPVRWNSAVKMMERIATNRQALKKLQQKYSLSLFVDRPLYQIERTNSRIFQNFHHWQNKVLTMFLIYHRYFSGPPNKKFSLYCLRRATSILPTESPAACHKGNSGVKTRGTCYSMQKEQE